MRKERKGNGKSRVYTITLSLTDVSGNTGQIDFQVGVPKSKKQTPVNSEVFYTEIPNCGETSARKTELFASPSMKVFSNSFKTNTQNHRHAGGV